MIWIPKHASAGLLKCNLSNLAHTNYSFLASEKMIYINLATSISKIGRQVQRGLNVFFGLGHHYSNKLVQGMAYLLSISFLLLNRSISDIVTLCVRVVILAHKLLHDSMYCMLSPLLCAHLSCYSPFFFECYTIFCHHVNTNHA